MAAFVDIAADEPRAVLQFSRRKTVGSVRLRPTKTTARTTAEFAAAVAMMARQWTGPPPRLSNPEIAEWLFAVSLAAGCSEEVLPVTLALFGRCASDDKVCTLPLRFVVLGCLFLASKTVDDGCCWKQRALVSMDLWTYEQLELTLLRALRWQTVCRPSEYYQWDAAIRDHAVRRNKTSAENLTFPFEREAALRDSVLGNASHAGGRGVFRSASEGNLQTPASPP